VGSHRNLKEHRGGFPQKISRMETLNPVDKFALLGKTARCATRLFSKD
jgi:hypothetical protein